VFSVLRNDILHITIPPHFKGIISVINEFLAPAVCTNRETDTHSSNVSLRIAHRLLSLVA